MTEHPPIAPLNRAAEIIEALWNLDHDRMAELLGILRQFDGPTLVRIFGSPASSPQTPPGPAAEPVQEPALEPAPEVLAAVEAAPEPPQPVTVLEHDIAEMRERLDTARFDDNGRRLNPGQRAFPRQYEPAGRPPGRTWLSD